jgi:hypothetical protein
MTTMHQIRFLDAVSKWATRLHEPEASVVVAYAHWLLSEPDAQGEPYPFDDDKHLLTVAQWDEIVDAVDGLYDDLRQERR